MQVSTSNTGSTTLNYDGHPGYDYPVGIGAGVYAAADGVVLNAVPTDSGASGRYIQIEHTGTAYLSQYLHLSRVDVTNNQSVLRGDLIGLTGNSGGVAAHLHFETKKKVGSNWVSVDPYGWQGAGTDPYIINTGVTNVCLWAGEAITNLMSSVVSYQYPEDYSSAALTNGGVMSPLVSYQYLEWPGNVVLGLVNSLPVSYFYQSGSSTAALVAVHGKVTNSNGVGIAGATISAAIALTPVAQTTTDSGGNYLLPALGVGAYVLKATATGYASSARALILSASVAAQNFQLSTLLVAPPTQQTTRQPPATFTQPPVGPVGSTLKIFDGTTFATITANNVPAPDLMTVVLTHGWNSDPSVWAANMAAQLRDKGLTTNIANVVAWDWQAAASGAIPEERTPSQGVALGQALVTSLGTTYSQPIHFIGHSLGALVNAAAANYLHGDRTAQQAISSTPWSPTHTHMTLLDAAESATALKPILKPLRGDR